MIRIGGEPLGKPGEDTEFCGLIYPDGDEISKHMAERLRAEPFYQSDKLVQALRLVKQRRVAVDCGAWVGGWSRHLGTQFRKVISIEANPDNARCVHQNTSKNVRVCNAAVGDRCGEICIAKEGDGPNVGSFVCGEGAVKVLMLRLDDMPEIHNAGALDYMKVHVNGMELRALLGAKDLIRRYRPVLTVVLKPAIERFGDTIEDARQFLREHLGYAPAGGERPYEIWCPR